MALQNEYPVISSNLKAGYGVYGTCDTYSTTAVNNGALNPPGSVSYIPSPSQSGSALASSNGYGSGLWVKYVRYNSTANPAVVVGPAPVYWTDETYTTVTGVFSEGMVAGTGSANSIAGWLLPNSGTAAGTGVGTAFSAAVLNGNWVFIGLCGFIPGAISVASTAVGDALIGASGNFTVARVAAGTAPTNIVAGWARTAIASSVSDVMAVLPIF